MPIIDFNPESLLSGYQDQINSFNKKQNSSLLFHKSLAKTTTTSLQSVAIPELGTSVGIGSFSGETTKEFRRMKAQSHISAILDELKRTIARASMQTEFQGLPTPPLTNEQWEYFEYSRDVPKLLNAGASDLVNTLWGLRHALCYQLLIYTYYQSQEKYTVEDVNLFKLGIFGSLTPTSDIDIGVQYSKKTQRKVGIIADVIRTFEDAFISLTQKYSLAYDIEPYASIEFLDDDEGGLFYCDSTDFDNNDLMQIMPAIGASIIRNVVQSSIDVCPKTYPDIRRYKSQQHHTGGTIDTITALINTFTFNDITKYFITTVKDSLNAALLQIDKTQLQTNVDYISRMLTNPKWLPDAKVLAIKYMTKPYNDSRNLYYSNIETAEALLANESFFLFDRGASIEKSVRVALMKQNAEALVFRAESYVSPSTVMHIVRVLQAGEKLEPSPSCKNLLVKKSKAQCAIGTYGYIMSCMEQIGYLYRFNKTYCENNKTPCEENSHKDPIKCKSKFDKYFPRLVDGLLRFRKSSSNQTGGKRRNYSKKLHKLKTQKRKNISKRNSKQLRHRTNKRMRTHI